MKLLVQVLDQTNTCLFEQRIVDVPADMFLAPGEAALSIEGVKTALDYHIFLKKEAAEMAQR